MFEFLLTVGFIWFFVAFIDTIFKTCMFHPYFRMLDFTGLHIKPLMISLKITRFNRFINRIGQRRSRSLRKWFDVGMIIACIIALPSLVVYSIAFYQMLTASNMEEYNSSVLVPVIPGYNIPSSHWMYYIIIYLLCSVVHEFGHAVAASRESVSIIDCGCTLLAVFPVAFVNMRSDQFRQTTRWQQMRILCAGVWHNIILALVAIMAWITLSTLLSPIYNIDNGITVTGISEQSGLNNPSGLKIGDEIHSIDNCKITFIGDWISCLQDVSKGSQAGLCVPQNISSEPREFCLDSSTFLSFRHKGDDSTNICLQARGAVQKFSLCNHNSDCEMSSLCMFPVLSSEAFRFVVIKRNEKVPVLFEGTIQELFTDVQVSQFTRRSKFFPVSFIEIPSTFLLYVAMFSSGLACLNMLPIMCVDGQFIYEILVHCCLERYVTNYDQRRNIFNCICTFVSASSIFMIILTAYKFQKFNF